MNQMSSRLLNTSMRHSCGRNTGRGAILLLNAVASFSLALSPLSPSFFEFCGITSDDADDMRACLDEVGRDQVLQMWVLTFVSPDHVLPGETCVR